MKVIENHHSFQQQSIDVNQRVKERNYWLNKLSGNLEKTSFPYDPREKGQNKPVMKAISFSLTGELFSKLMRLSNNSDIRLYIILMTLLVLLLEKYTGNKDIIVGAPIYKQDIEGDFINKIVVLRNQLRENMSFKELLLQVSQTNFEAMEHINYPLETIPYQLNMSFPEDEFPLFDVAILLDNLHDKSYIKHLNLDVIFSFDKKEDCIEGVVEYNDSLYSEETGQRIISHYSHLAGRALADIDVKIAELSVISDEEIKQLVVDMNATTVTDPAYPCEKMIHELFREQVVRTPTHIALQYRENRLTYWELNEKANRLARRLKSCGIQKETIVAVLLERSPGLIVAILAILKAGGTYLPIDTEYLRSRIHYLLADSNSKHLISSKTLADQVEFAGTVIHFHNGDQELLQNKPGEYSDDLPPEVSSQTNHPDRLAYVMYTSGSTGKPKGVMIHHSSVVNYVWWAAQTYVRGKKLNFPLYSSISFDLTVTSIFTPLITGNSIVVYEGEEKNFLIEDIIDENKVGVIKLTPSHLYVIKHKDLRDSNVKCFIVGGEIFETRIARDIADKFNGNIEIYNEYGPTEATVGCLIYKFNPAKDNYTSVPIGIPIARAQIYLLDYHRKPVPVGVSGEIYVSGNGVARGYLNSPELTAQKFQIPNSKFQKNNASFGQSIQSCIHATMKYRSPSQYPITPLPHYPIYQTGDLARWLPGGNLEFLGRRDSQVKIRGYRIELAEIEQQLLQHEEIKETVVIARDAQEKSSLDEKQDQYLSAYFVSDKELQVSELREFLLTYLDDYMVPLFFVQLEKIPLTSNGKTDRKALPVPEIKKEINYVAPRDEMEAKLVDIWSDVLRIDRDVISIDANFFQLGGQSLKQVNLISQIHKEFNVHVPLAEIFENQTIRELSGYIRRAAPEEYFSIKPVEDKEYYEVSSPQRRLYALRQIDFEGTVYNVSFMITLAHEIDKGKGEKAFRQMLERHETLRTSFILVENRLVQKIEKHVDFKVEYHDLENEGISARLTIDRAVSEIIRQFIRPFDLSWAPLFRIGLIRVKKEECILMVDIHHIINDGVSLDIMIHEFAKLYWAESLPPLRIQYKDYSQWQKSKAAKERIKKQEDYWLKEFEQDIPLLNIPTDYPRPVLQSFEGSGVGFEIGRKEAADLIELGEEQGVSLFMLLITTFNILLLKLSGQEDILVGTPVAARRHADLEPVIGMFVNTLVLRNYPQREKTIIEFLQEVKVKILNAFDNQEYQFEDLLEKVKEERDPSRNPLFGVVFSWLDLIRDTGSLESLMDFSIVDNQHNFEIRSSKFDMHWMGRENDGDLFFFINYCTKLFKEETILRMIDYFKKIISVMRKSLDIKLSQIDILTEEEKERLIKKNRDEKGKLFINKNIEKNQEQVEYEEVEFDF